MNRQHLFKRANYALGVQKKWLKYISTSGNATFVYKIQSYFATITSGIFCIPKSFSAQLTWNWLTWTKIVHSWFLKNIATTIYHLWFQSFIRRSFKMHIFRSVKRKKVSASFRIQVGFKPNPSLMDGARILLHMIIDEFTKEKLNGICELTMEITFSQTMCRGLHIDFQH